MWAATLDRTSTGAPITMYVCACMTCTLDPQTPNRLLSYVVEQVSILDFTDHADYVDDGHTATQIQGGSAEGVGEEEGGGEA